MTAEALGNAGTARRRRGRTALALLLAGGLALLVARGAGAQGTPAAPAAAALALDARTVIVVRHAEKDASGDPRDPSLSAAGAERAHALAKLLAPAGVDALFASEYKRTRETLAPLAQLCEKPVTAVPAGKPAELLAALEALPAGSVAVVAGHSNTVPALVRALGATPTGTSTGPQGEMLADDAYGRMFVLTRVPRAAPEPPAVTLIEMAYGG
jgi:phosphohistidine phosphatase SixA